MIVRNRRALKSRQRSSNRVRPEQLDFPQIRKEVKLFAAVGVVLKGVTSSRSRIPELMSQPHP